MRPGEVAPGDAPVAGEGQGLVPVHVVEAGAEEGARVAVAHGRRDVDVDPAQLVDHGRQSDEAGGHHVGDVDADQAAHRRGHELGAAVGVGGVDLVGAVAGDVGVGVAGDVEDGRPALAGVDADEVDAVGPADRLARPGVVAQDEEEDGAAGRRGEVGLVDLVDLDDRGPAGGHAVEHARAGEEADHDHEADQAGVTHLGEGGGGRHDLAVVVVAAPAVSRVARTS